MTRDSRLSGVARVQRQRKPGVDLARLRTPRVFALLNPGYALRDDLRIP